jgi:3-hydroxyisobutyrate dehydrogenase
VLLSLPEGRHVRAVVEGPGGVIASNHPGTLVIDATTSEAATSRDLAAKCLEAGHAFIDAPVSGGPHGAAAGTLAIMVGGAAEDLERARPYLEHLAGNLVHVGASGAGNVAKLVNNLMAAAELVIAAEGMRLAVRAGIEPEALLNVVNSASGRSFCTEHVLPRMLERGGLDAGFGFSAGLMRKDVRLAIELAAATKTHMRLGEAAWKIWAESRRAVPDDADFSRLAGELIQHGHRITDT